MVVVVPREATMGWIQAQIQLMVDPRCVLAAMVLWNG